jgi:hypothetical protein
MLSARRDTPKSMPVATASVLYLLPCVSLTSRQSQHVLQHVVRAAVAHDVNLPCPLQVPCLDLVVDPALSQIGDGKECPDRPPVADVDVCLLIHRMASTLVGFKNLGATESRYSICDI